jgi:hypothetical protein
MAACDPVVPPEKPLLSLEWTTKENNLQDKYLGDNNRLPAYNFAGRKIAAITVDPGYIPVIGLSLTTTVDYDEGVDAYLEYLAGDEFLDEYGEPTYTMQETSAGIVVISIFDNGDIGTLLMFVEPDEDSYISITSYVVWAAYPTNFMNASFLHELFVPIDIETIGCEGYTSPFYGSSLRVRGCEMLAQVGYNSEENAINGRTKYIEVMTAAGFAVTNLQLNDGSTIEVYQKGGARVYFEPIALDDYGSHVLTIRYM